MKEARSNRKPKAGPGRNPLPIKEKKSVKMQVYLSPTEHESLIQKATSANLILNDFVRQMLLEGKVTNIESEGVQESKMNLIKIGNNLNQLTRLANSLGMITELPKINAAIDTLYEVLDSYRR